MTTLKFTKMNGLGNDFVILDYEEFEKTSMPINELAIKLCNRYLSVGADGLMIINNDVKEADAGWIFYNSDGTIPQMCGNGIRCFAKYIYDKGLINKKKFTVKTVAGIKEPEIIDKDNVRVNMSKPILTPSEIPFCADNNLNRQIELKSGEIFEINAISMGNPHCIIFTGDNTAEKALKYGAEVECSKLFPEKTNVEFVKIISRNEIKVDVWERGCGITQACGTGACASAVAAILNGFCDKKVKVNLPGGSLTIEWAGSKNDTDYDVFMTGTATYSFTGEVEV